MPTATPAPAGDVRPRPWHRAARCTGALSLAAAAVFLAGCGGTPTAADPVLRPHELADAGNRPCPDALPTGDDPSGHGFGTSEPADERPALLDPQEAWVCQYSLYDGTPAEREPTWRRTGQTAPVSTTDLPALRAALDDLAPADESRTCTADLGPRWLVVYSHGGDLTGVVVDDYGCQEVRLTDDPYATAPGAERQQGTVGGVLDNGREVLAAVGVGREG